ncbi:MAG: hypothetical protein DSZ32_07455 [Gammaproteobacteria bacterium]|nr:MAG: hypothetical protein DSZ32_07455 [Gammaproteobacteria bacterium]
MNWRAKIFSASLALWSATASAGGYMSYGLGYNSYDDWGYPYSDYPYSWGPHHYYGGHHYGYGYPGVSLGYSSHGGDAGSLLAGLLLGGLLVRAISQSDDDRYDRSTDIYRAGPEPASVYPGSVIDPGVSTTRVVESVNSGCLMTREYTGMITVNGEQQRAYGTRCMKPDGSWEYGPLKAEPDF